MSTRSKVDARARRRIELHREVARHEMAIGLQPLFRVLPQAHCRRREVLLEGSFAGCIVRIRAIEMSVFEQGVFLALICLAMRMDKADVGPPNSSLLPTHSGLPSQFPDGGGHGDNLAMTAATLTVKTSMAELARTAGLARKLGSHTRDAIDAALARLAMATIFVRAEDGRWGLTHLISGARGHGRDSIEVQINARSARAVLDGGSYAAISMRDWRTLSSDVAKALYAWLQAWFGGSRAANTRKISMEKLIEHAYGRAAKSKSTHIWRRKACLKALTELSKLGWRVSLAGEMVSIARSTPSAEPKYAEC